MTGKALAEGELFSQTGSYTYEYQYVEVLGVKDNVYTLNIGDELSHEMDQLYTEFAYRLASWEV